MAPVARKLSLTTGVLEPIQNGSSIDELVSQLKSDIENHMEKPAILIGHSWGAWLGFIFSAKHPSLVKKLIMVSSGPFKEQYASLIMEKRLSRLNENEKSLFIGYVKGLGDTDDLEPLKELFLKTDAFDPVRNTDEKDNDPFIPASYRNIWNEADHLRKSGRLLKLAGSIRCPVTAIHGDYDPHPAEGVEKPLSTAIRSFKFIVLENCGHYPWKEKQAVNKFYSVLIRELGL